MGEHNAEKQRNPATQKLASERQVKSSHGYTGENTPNLISVYPVSSWSSETAQADRISVVNIT